MMKRLLITGANGSLGMVCRKHLPHMADIVRLATRKDIGPAAAHEEIVQCDLSDSGSVNDAVKGCDGIVHLAGQAREAPWELIRTANIEGMFNVYEAARKNNVKRIVYASSNHATGFYKQTDRLDGNTPPRPDGLYGVSKVFGEALARMYFDKFGIETACLRIGSCFPEPKNHRMLATWLSYGDLIRLIERAFDVPELGCPIIYGVSNNDGTWWDNAETSYVGWKPKDNAETFRAALDAKMAGQVSDDMKTIYQGGRFTQEGIHEN